MKLRLILVAALAIIATQVQAQEKAGRRGELKSLREKASYSFGMTMGNSVAGLWDVVTKNAEHISLLVFPPPRTARLRSQDLHAQTGNHGERRGRHRRTRG